MDRDKWLAVLKTDELSDFIKCGEFLDCLEKDSSPEVLCSMRLLGWLVGCW
jgi:hypothetical protein